MVESFEILLFAVAVIIAVLPKFLGFEPIEWNAKISGFTPEDEEKWSSKIPDVTPETEENQ